MRKIVFIIIAILLLVGCKSKQAVIESKPSVIKIDSVMVSQIVKDSVYLHDRVLVMAKGDTIWKEKWHTKYVERLRHDTIWRQNIVHDTICVTETKTNHSPSLNNGRGIGGWVFFFFITGIILVLVIIVRKTGV